MIADLINSSKTSCFLIKLPVTFREQLVPATGSAVLSTTLAFKNRKQLLNAFRNN